MEEESKRRIAQMCYEIVNMISEGKTVEDINSTDEHVSCDDIDCIDCPLSKTRQKLKLCSCMQLNETQLLNACREYLNAYIYSQAKNLSKEEIKELIAKLLKLL